LISPMERMCCRSRANNCSSSLFREEEQRLQQVPPETPSPVLFKIRWEIFGDQRVSVRGLAPARHQREPFCPSRSDNRNFRESRKFFCSMDAPASQRFDELKWNAQTFERKYVPSEVFRLRLESPSLQGSLVPRIPAAKGFPATATFVSRPTSEAIRFSRARFLRRTEELFAASQVEHDRVAKSSSSRFGPSATRGEIAHRTVEKRGIGARFLREGAAIATRRLGTLLPVLFVIPVSTPSPWLCDWWQTLS